MLQNNENDIQSLKNELNGKNKRLMAILQTSRTAMNARSDLEVFFIEQLQECKIEMAKKKKLEEERKKNIFPFLNMSISSQFNNNSGSTEDDSFFLTSAKKVEIKDIDPEYKEKLLRNLLKSTRFDFAGCLVLSWQPFKSILEIFENRGLLCYRKALKRG